MGTFLLSQTRPDDDSASTSSQLPSSIGRHGLFILRRTRQVKSGLSCGYSAVLPRQGQ